MLLNQDAPSTLRTDDLRCDAGHLDWLSVICSEMSQDEYLKVGQQHRCRGQAVPGHDMVRMGKNECVQLSVDSGHHLGRKLIETTPERLLLIMICARANSAGAVSITMTHLSISSDMVDATKQYLPR